MTCTLQIPKNFEYSNYLVKYMGIAENFTHFCNNLKIGPEIRSGISLRYEKITQRLNKDFYNTDSTTSHSRYVGSYGRGTAIKGFSDLDILFQLPHEVYVKYNSHLSNSQSNLLQEVRNSISKTYSTSEISADGQVVVVSFSDNIRFEVMPSFINKNKSYTYPDSNNGGSWKITNPIPEIDAISSMDSNCNSNLKNLCKMTRAWKNKWDVPIGGLLIDTLAHNFIKNWDFKDKSYFYYDWLCRDFFKYLSEQNKDQKHWFAVGSNQIISRKGLFEAKAKKCYELSLVAIKSESDGYPHTAKSKWSEIFGTEF